MEDLRDACARRDALVSAARVFTELNGKVGDPLVNGETGGYSVLVGAHVRRQFTATRRGYTDAQEWARSVAHACAAQVREADRFATATRDARVAALRIAATEYVALHGFDPIGGVDNEAGYRTSDGREYKAIVVRASLREWANEIARVCASLAYDTWKDLPFARAIDRKLMGLASAPTVIIVSRGCGEACPEVGYVHGAYCVVSHVSAGTWACVRTFGESPDTTIKRWQQFQTGDGPFKNETLGNWASRIAKRMDSQRAERNPASDSFLHALNRRLAEVGGTPTVVGVQANLGVQPNRGDVFGDYCVTGHMASDTWVCTRMFGASADSTMIRYAEARDQTWMRLQTGDCWIDKIAKYMDSTRAGSWAETPTTKKEDTTIMNTTKNIITDGAKLAAGLAATERLNALCVDLLTKALAKFGLPDVLLSTPAVQQLVRLLAPLAVANLVQFVPQFGQHAGKVNKACTLAFAAEVQSIMVPLLAEIGPMLSSFADAANAIDVTPSETPTA